MSNLLVFTTGTDLDLLQKSCQDVMITLSWYDCPFVDYVECKLRRGIEFLTNRIWPHPYCMWVDGNDSLILKPESEILARLNSMGDPVVISGESTCWPDAELASKYPDRPSPRFINAGGFIGPFGAVCTAMHTALQAAKALGTGDDQRAWTSSYLAGMQPDLQIDHARRIFASVGDGDVALKADSCVKHFNGKIPGRKEYWDAIQSK